MGGTDGKFRENGQKQGNLLLCKLRSGQFYKGILVSTPWYQNLCITLVFLYVRSNYLLKTEEVSFQAKFCPDFAALPYVKLGTFSKRGASSVWYPRRSQPMYWTFTSFVCCGKIWCYQAVQIFSLNLNNLISEKQIRYLKTGMLDHLLFQKVRF